MLIQILSSLLFYINLQELIKLLHQEIICTSNEYNRFYLVIQADHRSWALLWFKRGHRLCKKNRVGSIFGKQEDIWTGAADQQLIFTYNHMVRFGLILLLPDFVFVLFLPIAIRIVLIDFLQMLFISFLSFIM